MEAREFNTYLADDGIPDELAARQREGRASEANYESRWSTETFAVRKPEVRASVRDSRASHYGFGRFQGVRDLDPDRPLRAQTAGSRSLTP